jgi:hypothetical protein
MTMGMREYNLGLMAVDLHTKAYTCRTDSINERMDRIEENTEQLSLLTDFLTRINAALQENPNLLDLSEHQDLVDQVREICPHLLPDGVYTWKGKDQIDLLKEGISHQSKKIAMMIDPDMMYNNQNLQDIAELTKIFSDIIKSVREQGQHLVKNQRS